MLEKGQGSSAKNGLFLSQASIVQVQPIIWQRNEGILRQALMSSEKEGKPAGGGEKSGETQSDGSSGQPAEKTERADLVEAINLYPTGSDNSEYTSQLLSQLTATLPTISSSHISSVLSELEPALTQEASIAAAMKMCESKDKDKQPQPSLSATDVLVEVRIERHVSEKGTWYKCATCGFVCIEEARARMHGGTCSGPGLSIPCMACHNVFKSDTVLKAHLLVDHCVPASDHPSLVAINLAINESLANSKADRSEPTERTESKREGEIKREKKLAAKATKKAVKNIKVEKDAGIRCRVDGCAVRFTSSANMEYHRQCHNGVKWKCVECGEDFQSWPNLWIHLWKQHGLDMELYSCDQCTYKTNSLSKLMNLHRRTHGTERPFLCDLCGKGFKTTKQLRNHKNVHKPKDRSVGPDETVSCEICGRSFACPRMLKHHTDIVHRKLRPYLCSHCGHSAASKSSLRMHARQHTGEKPYMCGECDYRTSDHNTLRRHKMRHTGAKHYSCPHCPYASIQSSTFKSHLKNKHPGLDVGLMFSCEICPFKTVKRENFLAHTSYHSLKPGDNELSKEGEVHLVDEYNLRNLVKEVSRSILPCGGRSFLSESQGERLKAEEILSRERDPLLADPDPNESEDIIGEAEP